MRLKTSTWLQLLTQGPNNDQTQHKLSSQLQQSLFALTKLATFSNQTLSRRIEACCAFWRLSFCRQSSREHIPLHSKMWHYFSSNTVWKYRHSTDTLRLWFGRRRLVLYGSSVTWQTTACHVVVEGAVCPGRTAKSSDLIFHIPAKRI